MTQPPSWAEYLQLGGDLRVELAGHDHVYKIDLATALRPEEAEHLYDLMCRAQATGWAEGVTAFCHRKRLASLRSQLAEAEAAAQQKREATQRKRAEAHQHQAEREAAQARLLEAHATLVEFACKQQQPQPRPAAGTSPPPVVTEEAGAASGLVLTKAADTQQVREVNALREDEERRQSGEAAPPSWEETCSHLIRDEAHRNELRAMTEISREDALLDLEELADAAKKDAQFRSAAQAESINNAVRSHTHCEGGLVTVDWASAVTQFEGGGRVGPVPADAVSNFQRLWEEGNKRKAALNRS